MHSREDTTFVDIQLRKKDAHSILLKARPLLSLLRLKMESAPRQVKHAKASDLRSEQST
jgi:hypothetical protein